MALDPKEGSFLGALRSMLLLCNTPPIFKTWKFDGAL